jgi:hypothetical protein
MAQTASSENGKHLFDGPKLKVERANRHISELNTEIESFRDRHPYRLVIERAPDPKRYNMVIRVNEEMPCVLPPIIGDVAHNLRASLDLLACDLVRQNGGSTKGVYFPFSENGDRFEEMIVKRRIDRAAPEVVDIIRSLKPYKGGNIALRGIHDLDIGDKHIQLTPIAMVSGIPDHQLRVGDKVLYTMIGSRVCPVKDGTIVISFPIVNNLKIGDESEPTFDVLFGRGQPFEYEPVVPTLKQLSELIDGIIDTFVRHFSA